MTLFKSLNEILVRYAHINLKLQLHPPPPPTSHGHLIIIRARGVGIFELCLAGVRNLNRKCKVLPAFLCTHARVVKWPLRAEDKNSSCDIQMKAAEQFFQVVKYAYFSQVVLHQIV